MKFLMITFAFLTAGSISSEIIGQSPKRVSLTLKNNTLKSIPLKIPGYMNPNLSPMSTSGVELNIGQKVFFTFMGKKTLLVTIAEELSGQTLVVNQLIKQREKELLAE